MRSESVYIACVGDSRCVLGEMNPAAEAYGVGPDDGSSSMWTAHALSVDQKPELPEERARLEAHGAEVRQTEPGGPWRAVGKTSNYLGQGGSFRMALAMSRSLGDYVWSAKRIELSARESLSDVSLLIVSPAAVSQAVWRHLQSGGHGPAADERRARADTGFGRRMGCHLLRGGCRHLPKVRLAWSDGRV